MKYTIAIIFAILVIFRITDQYGKTHFFQRWETSSQTCEAMCYSSGQEYSKVKQYSAGICTCDNEEGRKATSAYHYCLNNPCDLENY